MAGVRPRFSGLDAALIRRNLLEVRDEIAAAAAVAGRTADQVEIVAAGKYVAAEEFGALVEAGITVVGENRAQDLVAKAHRWGDQLKFDFIGQLQSRKVSSLLEHSRLIHSVASDSALEQLRRHADPSLEVLVSVNLSGETSKAGVAEAGLDAFIERCPVPVVGLMTMPPASADPDGSRPYFARLRELAAARGLERLSMGTTQDYVVAVEEGATIVRIGTRLFREADLGL